MFTINSDGIESSSAVGVVEMVLEPNPVHFFSS